MPRAPKELPELEKDPPATVGFYLEVKLRRVLQERAKSAGISCHLLAKLYVLERLLGEEERTAIGQALKTLHQDAQDFRSELTVAAKALASSTEEERGAVSEGLQIIHQNVQDLRTDFAFAVKALLVSAGKVTKEKASAWVDQSIKPD